MNDLRYGWRMLRRSPGFTLVAVLMLAIGIGANTIIFSGVYSLLLQPLPYPHSERLAVIARVERGGRETGIPDSDFTSWRDRCTVCEQLCAVQPKTVNLAGEPAERATGSAVSEEFFSLLGGRAIEGRLFLADDFRPGAEPVAILSRGLWERRFGASPSIIGRQIKLDDADYTVIGVTPMAFRYPFRAEFWTPLEARAGQRYDVLARLRPGATPLMAATELTTLARATAREESRAADDFTINATALRETLPGLAKYRQPVLALQCAVICVLLIACANLANLLLARATVRRREFVVRLALGAGRGRIIRQLLIESLMIGLAGGLLGLMLALWGIDALRVAIPWRAPWMQEVGLSAPILLVTMLASILTSIGFGLAPALAASRENISAGLKATGPTPDPRRRRFGSTLLAAEVALAVTLLATSGLMVRTFLNLTDEDPGFQPEGALALALALPTDGDSAALASFYDQMIARLRALPGVTEVGGVTYPPLVGYNPGIGLELAGRSSEVPPRVDYQPVTPGYFAALGIPLRRGRDFTRAEIKATLDGGMDRAIINEALARKYFDGADPLGQSIRLREAGFSDRPLTIVGVVGDVRQFGLHTEPRPEVYLPAYRPAMTLIVRTNGPAGSLFGAVLEAARRIGESRAAYSLKTMEQSVSDSIERRRILALLLGSLAGTALLLSAFGIYSVLSHLVAQRTRELGIRFALGARRADVLRLVIGQGMRLVLFGLILGGAASVALSRLIKSLLYGVSTGDPVTLAATGMLLALVALGACYLPARRAARVDPIIALRSE